MTMTSSKHPDPCFLAEVLTLSSFPGRQGVMEGWGRVLGLPHLGKDYITGDQKPCGQVAINHLSKKRAKSIPGTTKKSIKSKGQNVSGSKARRGSELDGIRFEGPERGAVLGHCSMARVHWVREPPKARHPHVP